eukprot:364743-Chlamydomonas_euryale.AAC.91
MRAVRHLSSVNSALRNDSASSVLQSGPTLPTGISLPSRVIWNKCVVCERTCNHGSRFEATRMSGNLHKKLCCDTHRLNGLTKQEDFVCKDPAVILAITYCQDCQEVITQADAVVLVQMNKIIVDDHAVENFPTAGTHLVSMRRPERIQDDLKLSHSLPCSNAARTVNTSPRSRYFQVPFARTKCSVVDDTTGMPGTASVGGLLALLTV